jgi:GTP-binding protein
MRLPIVAIIGRPNVGKSTLFNRMIKRKKAVVAEEPGVTRDRNYYPAEWNRKSFYLVDTGGLDPQSNQEIPKLVKAQTEIAIQESDLILFLIDFQVGIQSIELELARQLRKIKKKVVLVVNKVDKPQQLDQLQEARRLGLGEPFGVSAKNGLSVAELLDYMAQELPEEISTSETEGIRVAVIGRPNVGKSSFVNAILGQEKLIVSEIPGTTRDSIDTQIEKEGEKFILVDTAGLRHRSKDIKQLEYYTSLRTLRAIREAEVVALLVEAAEGLVKQDLRIAEQVIEAGKGIIIVVNKWDLVDTKVATPEDFSKYVQQRASFLTFAPFLFVSAKTGLRMSKTLPLVSEIYKERQKRVETSELNEKIGAEIERNPPPAAKGKYIKIYYITQVDTEPPEFVFFSNYPELLADHYLRFLEQKIRVHFGFEGVPFKMKLKKRK